MTFKRFFFAFSLLYLADSSGSYAQTDSVIITGRILNLTAPLYRSAPAITFSRNNLLQLQTELTRQAPLQADGSFRVSLPLIFSQEEIYLDYGGLVFTTFLASPGQVQISFDADSMFKARKLFYFAGVQAEANNQYSQYVMEETRLMQADKRYGANFFEYFWEQSSTGARRDLQRRTELRLSALKPLESQGNVAPGLLSWVQALANDEQLALLYEHALSNDLNLEQGLLDSLARLAAPPLTFQHVTWATRTSHYLERQIRQWSATNPSRARALPVDQLASLILRYVSPLSATERLQLTQIREEKSTQNSGVEFMSKLYMRNRRAMDLITGFEKSYRICQDLFGTNAADFFAAYYPVSTLHLLTLDDQNLLYNHVKDQIQQPQFRASLDELFRLETKDSAAIRTVLNRRDLGSEPKEVQPGIWLAQSEIGGTAWFRQIQNLYKGKTLYLIKWSLDDDVSRRELAFAPALRAQLPNDVEFLYIHLSDDDSGTLQDLWKQYTIRHQLRGVHLYLNYSQALALSFRLNPLSSPSFAILKPNGKYYTRKAPPLSDAEKVRSALLDARRSR
ncbi:hypothetical protein GCM10027275_40580 [Rhabdobacter roseus]|uniref:Thioredoxin domain-containing protein n=1 Tax=Rhabdobacter roseus TaxID=1655419 RepID=A0A840TWR0_9BACT|nr:hypothetical protein [Rhabdobacter roseus]MBB5286032.1 hypothetical protein [Rhabdobacter roseus]